MFFCTPELHEYPKIYWEGEREREKEKQRNRMVDSKRVLSSLRVVVSFYIPSF